MIAALRKLHDKAYGVPEKRLLWINAGIACFVALAHGGALAITYTKPTSNTEGIRQLASISLPIATIVIATAGAALIQAKLSRKVLAIHGLALAAGAAALLLWATSLIVEGIPKGNFSWSVGLLSASVAYSIFLVCRFSLPAHLRTRPAIFYAPAIALVVAAAVDVGVFLRFMGEIGVRIAQ